MEGVLKTKVDPNLNHKDSSLSLQHTQTAKQPSSQLTSLIQGDQMI